MPLVSLRDVAKRYPSPQKGAAPIAAIDGVDLDIEAGDVFGIIGYSGAGKSTLVRLINALEPATSGSIVVDGTEVTTLSERGLRDLRLGIGMIFQQFNLFNSKSVRKNIAYPLEVAGRPRAEIRTRVDELLKFVGLSDKADNYPDQLSGGQKQRVGIARALATSPRILLADEATSALDPETTQEVLALLKQVNRDLGVTIVVITHEMEVIQSLATKVAVMERGKVIEQGDVFEVFSDPQHAASKRFVSTVIKGVPSPAELAVLKERHVGRIVTLSFRDGDASQAGVFLTLAQAGVDFELVYGGINDIQGRAFGHLTLALRGDDQTIDGALTAIGSQATVTEVR
ncbi:methionine ABC transporter ATP-binding protein [Plantibacter flavus]|jgi:D-methionine transport system ATP-binding protein|uniref:D-methionine transport system ATP-binding protein n=1 Tax=Plantibacter cousiniae (nom. nud.) TaxID=199709 RepID=A0ABY1LMU1_9MICO|nr:MULTISPECIES: methionine ABC transporter ATP-binding protein [Plantibacter]MBD8466969.1 methionine ABC transporter ATP-binding protein [Plantibacter sp. CFBP 8798]MBD8516158.1 methionine ABC transporter ATP-binding protein [Plantibacter sp. CFBP 8804]MDD9152434.1 methionine ABC transporter ATP-binding protein [Plantibacter flavus]TKJ98699.1 methionine ABC transporter ATP-binding protein [Plantibacter flavus]SKC52114.1 D-methionine transport system ATP-binding protein [Plantibacter cousiniae